MKTQFLPAVLLIALTSACASSPAAPKHVGTYLPDQPPSQRISQWQNLRYGMFIHYGMSTFTGDELDNGNKPSSTFNPAQSDTDQWAKVARDAGMHYAVLTAKHVAGHCLWDSQTPLNGKPYDYDVATSGNKTDVVRSFVKSCEKFGIAPGLYYCLQDGHNNKRDSRHMPAAYFTFVKGQLAELAHNNPEVLYYWIDIPRAATEAQRLEMYDLIRQIQPKAVILFNFGLRGSKAQLLIENTHSDSWPSDVLNTERTPLGVPFKPTQTFKGQTYAFGYEHCDCLGRDWFWTARDKMRPAQLFINMYNTAVNKYGGNLLLDVGPGKDGRISQDRIDRLMEIKRGIEQLKPVSAGK